MPQSPDGMAELCQGSRDTWTPSSEEGLRCFMSQTMTLALDGHGGLESGPGSDVHSWYDLRQVTLPPRPFVIVRTVSKEVRLNDLKTPFHFWNSRILSSVFIAF